MTITLKDTLATLNNMLPNGAVGVYADTDAYIDDMQIFYTPEDALNRLPEEVLACHVNPIAVEYDPNGVAVIGYIA